MSIDTSPTTGRKTCFVVMGFGTKTDFQQQKTYNLDKSYRIIITKALEDAGPECIRSDDVAHAGIGMKLDLNDYFPSCKLPRLYRARRRSGDEDRAKAAATVARLACQRQLDRNAATEWTRLTLLGMAFGAGDVAAAEEICDQVSDEGAAGWKLETTLEDLKQSAAQAKDADTRARLEAVCTHLAPMV